MSNVAINIAAEFTGKKAFKQAETSTDKLTKSVKRLAGGLILAFGTKQILNFSKASVKAFAEDDKAAKALGTTLKNLGLAYGANVGTVNGFINRLEMQTGVLDDELRPAMDRMLRATGSVTKAQELLSLALDISAGTGRSLTQVSQSLQKAYLGQTQALGRLGVGLTKAELSTSSFEEIQARLATLFAGQAAAAADTYAGSLAKLTVAGNNAKETIGEGFVDALMTASNSENIDALVNGINRISNAMADFIRETGKFIAITKSIFDFELFAKDLDAFKGMGNISMTVSSQDTQKADAARVKAQKAVTALTKTQLANQKKITQNKKLQAAIDKASLLLGKGEGVFDMEKIQIAAALENQAQALGKTTNAAQVLAIANDVARLNVKKSMLALEDAIASRDEAAITAATAKLNADLKILGALSGQTVKLADIKSILDSLKPKDLINQANLNEALAKITQMLKLLADMNGNINIKAVAATAGTGGGGGGSGSTTTTIPRATTPTTVTPPPGTDIIPTIPITFTSVTAAEVAAVVEFAEAAAARADAIATLTDSLVAAGTAILAASSAIATVDIGSAATSSIVAGMLGGADFGSAVRGANYAAQAAASYNITVNTGVGDPNAIAEAINQVLIDAINRGTLTNQILNVA